MLLPLLTGTMATALMFAGRGENGGFSYVVGAMFGVSSLSMLALSWGSHAGTPKKAETMRARREYLRHLAGLRRRVRETIQRQRRGLWYRHPDPHQLWSTVATHRLWERRPDDADFAVVRIATGPQSLATVLQPPLSRSVDDVEPMAAAALQRFLDAYSVVPDLPVALSLRGFARVYLRGGEPAAGLARAIVAQLAVFHAPDDVLVACCVEPGRRGDWEWTKWLPHALHPVRRDAVGPRRLVTTSAVELEELLDDAVHRPHLVAIVDGGDPAGHLAGSAKLEADGVTLLDLDDPPPRRLDRRAIVLEVTDSLELRLTTADEPAVVVGTADALSTVEVEALARQLAPLRLAAPTRGEPPTADDGPAELLGLGEVWAPRSTSRSPHRTAWDRTGCSSAPPVPASPNCCARSCWVWRRRTRPRRSTSCSSTSRAERRSRRSTGCRTPRPSSPTSPRSCRSSIG
jgi:S-DNA-T family DNA segregation ATPase FtsK/SpoIIIE